MRATSQGNHSTSPAPANTANSSTADANVQRMALAQPATLQMTISSRSMAPAPGDGSIATGQLPATQPVLLAIRQPGPFIPVTDFSIDHTDARGMTALMHAARGKSYGENGGNPEVLQKLIDAHADIRRQSSTGWTPVMYAACTGRFDNVQRLLELAPDLAATSQDNVTGQTALMLAAQNGSLETVRLLIELGHLDPQHIDRLDSQGWSALEYAGRGTNGPSIMSLLVEKGATGVIDKSWNYSGCDRLMHAAARGLEDEVKALLVSGTCKLYNKNYQAGHLSAFAYAVLNGHGGIARLLIDNGANINESLKAGESILFNAAANGRYEAVRILIELGADVNNVALNGATALAAAIEKEHVEVVEQLIAAGADVNCIYSSEHGNTLLLLACTKQNAKIVELLIKANVDINAAAKNGVTAITVAVNMQNPAIFQQLIDAKARVDQRYDLKNSAPVFNLACAKGNEKIIDLFLQAGVDVNDPAANGATAILVAIDKNRVALVSKLIAAGARLDVTYGDAGIQPLLLACIRGNEEIVDLLLKAGAPVHLADKQGRTPHGIAAGTNNKNMEEKLRNALIKSGRWTPLPVTGAVSPASNSPNVTIAGAASDATAPVVDDSNQGCLVQ